METLKGIFSNPIWNGIQGLITVLTFLFLLREKKSEIGQYFNKVLLIFGEIVRILILIFFGWLYSYFLFFIFVDLLSFLFRSSPFSLLDIVNDIFSWPPSYFKYVLPSSIAAMSTIDRTISKKRATFVGLVVSAISYIFLLFSDSQFNVIRIIQNKDNLDIYLVIFWLFSVVLASVLAMLLMGNFVGSLSTRGVYSGRTFIEKLRSTAGVIYNNFKASITKFLREYWPK